MAYQSNADLDQRWQELVHDRVDRMLDLINQIHAVSPGSKAKAGHNPEDVSYCLTSLLKHMTLRLLFCLHRDVVYMEMDTSSWYDDLGEWENEAGLWMDHILEDNFDPEQKPEKGQEQLWQDLVYDQTDRVQGIIQEIYDRSISPNAGPGHTPEDVSFAITEILDHVVLRLSFCLTGDAGFLDRTSGPWYEESEDWFRKALPWYQRIAGGRRGR